MHVELLVEHGAEVDAAEYKVTTTPLLIAVASNQTDVASYLLAKGADVRRQSASLMSPTITLPSTHLQQPNKAQNDSAGTTPLYAAVLQGNLAMVDVLLEAGADPHFVCVLQSQRAC